MKQKYKFIISLIGLYLSLFFSFNNSTVFISFALYACCLLFWVGVESFPRVLWYTLLVSLPFDIGKGFSVPMVMPVPGRELGYRVWMTVTPNLVLAFLLLLIKQIRNLRSRDNQLKRVQVSDLPWFFLLVFSFVSSFQPSVKMVSVYGWMELAKAITLFFLAKDFLREEKVLKNSLSIIFSWLLFEGLISSLQFISKGPLGLYIEEGVMSISFGKMAMDQFYLFRSFGTFIAPNRLGAFLVLSLLVSSAAFVKKSLIKDKLIVLVCYLAGVVGLILSLSRTSWFTFNLFLIIGFYLVYRFGYKISRNFKKIIIIILFCLIGLAPFIVIRLESLVNAFTYYGTGSVRWKLIKEAFHLIKLQPIWGVGFNHFTKAIVEWPVTDVRFLFLQPVHNIYLFFASEVGIPALFFFLLGILFVFRKIAKKEINRERKALFIFVQLAFFSYLFIGLFEPFFLQPVFDLAMLLLAMLEVLGDQEG
jgi:O-antigen ligase